MLVAGLLVLSVQGCLPGIEVGGEAREPVRWILVERRYGDLPDAPPSRDGKVNPDAVVLAFQPLYPEDLKWDVVVSPEEHFVELLGHSPTGSVPPGQVVTARVRVGRAKPNHRYLLEAVTTQPHVRVIGSNRVVVRGEEVSIFTFTSLTNGRGGVEIGVRDLGQESADP